MAKRTALVPFARKPVSSPNVDHAIEAARVRRVRNLQRSGPRREFGFERAATSGPDLSVWLDFLDEPTAGVSP
ncbi:hypothetical protein [Arthrobacter sp. StoSoilB5]|uniref:hypothetical protein n=1 Tax=Arthrobacter sp. StoSoilB5 TaxID=2830992 RepID=UPI001CC34449|nr:hypothetical protein [Arthrobacter sp. StoSoilB5]BCW44785.1 hypothetical protein StoSoilB5_19690 [Arthrobacter sp. StoSoilB5]